MEIKRKECIWKKSPLWWGCCLSSSPSPPEDPPHAWWEGPYSRSSWQSQQTHSCSPSPQTLNLLRQKQIRQMETLTQVQGLIMVWKHNPDGPLHTIVDKHEGPNKWDILLDKSNPTWSGAHPPTPRTPPMKWWLFCKKRLEPKIVHQPTKTFIKNTQNSRTFSLPPFQVP